MITLASTSQSRRALLVNAGVDTVCMSPGIDESMVKPSLLADGLSPRDVADALAELKARKASSRVSGLVVGADQTLDLDGQLIDKADSLEELHSILLRLRGRSHCLHSAVVVAEDGVAVWRTLKTARLVVRPFSDIWLDRYIEQCGEKVLSSAGGYHLESEGAQLFSQIEGDYFTVLGLPLIELLDYLRVRGELLS